MRKLVHSIALLLVFGLSAPVLAEPFEDGLAAYVKQDYAAAVKWFRLAAEQGNAQAQFNLGLMYGNGQGVPQDYVQAHKWFNLAASQYPASEKERRDIAVKNRAFVAAKMTPAQIAEAQKLASAWKPK